MKKSNFITTEEDIRGRLVFYPWGRGNESFFITFDERERINSIYNHLALAALFSFAAVVVTNIAVYKVPVFSIGLPLVNAWYLLGLVYTYKLTAKMTPNQEPSWKDDKAIRFGQRCVLCISGLIQAFMIIQPRAHFPEYAQILSVTAGIVALGYLAGVITLWVRKGRIRQKPTAF